MKFYFKPILLAGGSGTGDASQLIGGGDDEEEGGRRLMISADTEVFQNVNAPVEVFSIEMPTVEPDPEIIEPVQVEMIDLDSLGDLGGATDPE